MPSFASYLIPVSQPQSAYTSGLTLLDRESIVNCKIQRGGGMWPFDKRVLVPKPIDLTGSEVNSLSPMRAAFERKLPPGPGRKCPNCSEATFKRRGLVFKCSNEKCKAIGFYGRPENIGSGKGHKCPHCDRSKLHEVASEPVVWWCSGCRLVAVAKDRKTVRADT